MIIYRQFPNQTLQKYKIIVCGILVPCTYKVIEKNDRSLNNAHVANLRALVEEKLYYSPQNKDLSGSYKYIMPRTYLH